MSLLIETRISKGKPGCFSLLNNKEKISASHSLKLPHFFYRKPKDIEFERGKQHTACIIDTRKQESMGLLATTHVLRV